MGSFSVFRRLCGEDRKLLGEWAWREFVTNHFPQGIYGFEEWHTLAETQDIVVFRIAVACLGEKEVRRRLIQLKRSSVGR